jgi:hypothetical protein|tara:strand:+ start:443 stop:700 length:258 start_codon:yes stop_codon:yes gene_type:complete
MTFLKKQILLPILLVFATGANANDDFAALYRNSVMNENMRLHISTFDTKHGRDYNWENCQLVAKLMQNQPGVLTKFWCEIGDFRE